MGVNILNQMDKPLFNSPNMSALESYPQVKPLDAAIKFFDILSSPTLFFSLIVFCYYPPILLTNSTHLQTTLSEIIQVTERQN